MGAINIELYSKSVTLVSFHVPRPSLTNLLILLLPLLLFLFFCFSPSLPLPVLVMGSGILCCLPDPVDFDADVNLFHFELHRAIGKGAFGKVGPTPLYLRLTELSTHLPCRSVL